MTYIDDFIWEIIGEKNPYGEDFSITSLAVVCLMIVPLLAAGARRLHDTGRSGWWQLLWLTLIGGLLLIYWMAKDGGKDDNSFSPPPPKIVRHAGPNVGRMKTFGWLIVIYFL